MAIVHAIEQFDASVINSLENSMFECPPPVAGQLPGPCSSFRFAGMDVGEVLSIGVWSPVAIVFYIAGAYFLINTLMAGFTLMTSQGTPANIQGAKTRMTNSLVGLLIVFTAYWLVRIIGAVLGLDGIAGVFGGGN